MRSYPKGRKSPDPKPYACTHCGVEFLAKHKAKFCSTICMDRNRYADGKKKPDLAGRARLVVKRAEARNAKLSDWQKSLPAALPYHIRLGVLQGNDDCWIWSKAVSPDGYGWVSLDNKTHQTHRLVYRLINGEPPEGLVLDHLCRVRNCVNPAHLEPVTPRENLFRGKTPASAETCAKGHPLEWNGHQRRCVVCVREWKRLYAREYKDGLRRRAS